MPSAAYSIECRSLSKHFGSFKAVDQVDLALASGEVLGFIGPNGAGKSTTIRMLLGLSDATSGVVRIFGEDPRTSRDVRRRIGYSPGELRLDERFSVAATLDLWAELRGGVDLAFRQELVERLGVDTKKKVRSLSTGNRRKISLVGALMGRPELLILDEPTNGLDPLVQREFMTVLAQVVKNGTSVLLSSHIMGEVERLADRVTVIRQGRLIATGTTAELRDDAEQQMHLGFAGAAPAAAELENVRGVLSVERPDDLRLTIRWTGSPGPLLQALTRHDVVSMTAPEPDLETAFLSYYRSSVSSDAT